MITGTHFNGMVNLSKHTTTNFSPPCTQWTRIGKGLVPVVGTPIKIATPSASHRALVALHDANLISCVISQNTDGLHARSGMPLDTLWELHGNSWKSCCWSCDYEQMHTGPITGTSTKTGAEMDCAACSPTTPTFCHCIGEACPKCGHMLKKSIINFGENLNPRILTGAQRAADDARVCLALGSSLTVTPAADIPASVAAHGKLVIVNLQATPLDGAAAMLIHARMDVAMEHIMRELGVHIPPPPDTVPTAAHVAAASGGKMGTAAGVAFDVPGGASAAGTSKERAEVGAARPVITAATSGKISAIGTAPAGARTRAAAPAPGATVISDMHKGESALAAQIRALKV